MFIQRRKIVWIEPFMIRENLWYLTIYPVSCAGKFACFARQLQFPLIWILWSSVSGLVSLVSPDRKVKCRSCLWHQGLVYWILDIISQTRCSLASHYTGGKICVENISHFSIKVQILDHATLLYLTSLHPPVYRSVSSPSIAKNQDKWDLLLLLLLLLLFLRSGFFVLRCFRSYTVTDVHAEYARQVLSFVPVYQFPILHNYFFFRFRCSPQSQLRQCKAMQGAEGNNVQLWEQ